MQIPAGVGDLTAREIDLVMLFRSADIGAQQQILAFSLVVQPPVKAQVIPFPGRK